METIYVKKKQMKIREPEMRYSQSELEALNKAFKPLNYIERIEKLFKVYPEKDILFTSSFGTKSAFLIDAVYGVRSGHPIHTVNTGYLFDETLSYMDKLKAKYQLNINKILPDPIQHKLTTEEAWWKDHPRMCCTINKIAPLDPVIAEHKVWISGLLGFQTELRSKLEIFELKGDIIKFHPLIDLTEEEYLQIKKDKELLPHPLEVQGYGSVGCTHCTAEGKDRSGRWCNTKQTECGLHLNFYYKK